MHRATGDTLHTEKPKVLLTNGCSMTYGSELSDPAKSMDDDTYREQNCWPSHLARRLGIDEIHNLAVPSGSNDRVLRTTTEWILRNSAARTASDIFVVIGWSDPARREFLVEGEWRQIVPHHDDATPAVQALISVYRAAAWSDFESSIRFGTQVCLLQSLLREFGIRFLFFDAIGPVREAAIVVGQAGEPFFSHVDAGRYYGSRDLNSSMADVLSQEVPVWCGRHPSAEGHRCWAERLGHFIEANQILLHQPSVKLDPVPESKVARKHQQRTFVYP